MQARQIAREGPLESSSSSATEETGTGPGPSLPSSMSGPLESSSSSSVHLIAPEDLSSFHPPILVGYAFSAKKMQTMSLIMAEASQALSSIFLCPASTPSSVAFAPPSLLTRDALRLANTAISSISSSSSSSPLLRPTAAVSVSTSFVPSPRVSVSSARVSFVPLDLSFSLEEQHGGRFDVLLHKLTEDVRDRQNGLPAAAARLARLENYAQARPECRLVDPPARLLAVLDRGATADRLRRCLDGVPGVRAPRFAVCGSPADFCRATEGKGAFRRPVVAKPRNAAGAGASHRMVVVQKKGGEREVRWPALVQEYADHGGVLHKAYVLGDEAYLYARPSLPDLRRNRAGPQAPQAVVFDSQKPYPTREDFLGIAHNKEKRRKVDTHVTNAQMPKLTVEDVKPVAQILRKAFGLELFGFDVLMTQAKDGNNAHGKYEMLVVDVNYFPSYREVPNFPAKLAQYLTQRAVDARKTKKTPMSDKEG